MHISAIFGIKKKEETEKQTLAFIKQSGKTKLKYQQNCAGRARATVSEVALGLGKNVPLKQSAQTQNTRRETK